MTLQDFQEVNFGTYSLKKDKMQSYWPQIINIRGRLSFQEGGDHSHGRIIQVTDIKAARSSQNFNLAKMLNKFLPLVDKARSAETSLRSRSIESHFKDQTPLYPLDQNPVYCLYQIYGTMLIKPDVARFADSLNLQSKSFVMP